MAGEGEDVEVGDVVDVPGGMYGAVKFVGTVRGKKGLGVFVPLHRARKRSSLTMSSESYPPTPTTPSYSNFSMSTADKPRHDSGTPSVPRFAQTIGPGARASSPDAKSRPSLARPESPYRRHLTATPASARAVTPAKSGRATPSAGPPRFTSPAPRGPIFQKPRTPGPARPYSRTGSRLGQHDTIDEDGESSVGSMRMSSMSLSPSKTRRPISSAVEEEVQRLKKLLEERDQQLSAQAASLAEMEASLAEIQNLMPEESNDVTQLRALLREKNEKINMLTVEFDNHRADFRNTIDTLEMASAETERIYGRKVHELEEEIRELHERGEDVESVANQLKQLEELVQELEEGLEDARRGEAEARGEVEFLRGEVERGRSELRREREKAAAALKGAGAMVDGPRSPGAREVEQRDDEIRGLKAIIHSLSSGPDHHSRSPQRSGSQVDQEELKAAHAKVEVLERDKEELRGLVERKTFREEELEREIERLRKQLGAAEQRDSIVSNGMSEHTATQEKRTPERILPNPTPKARQTPPRMEPLESDGRSSAEGSVLWCEICETGGHDILNCSAMGAGAQSPMKRAGKEPVVEGMRNLSLSSDHARPAALSPSKSPGNAPTTPLPSPFAHNNNTNISNNSSLVPPKGASVADPDKWCALCESEGHDVTACPNEDAF
ncbi:hypothetical protein M011DRAFT_395589 [Sporormia fimetaria CBS 119925]|uniref:CLIP1 zinc knuckle domain-containing protein n=1 Tax=Sporormia fimetaria CBS 119925 TaxID=1340428 RepID=A0A6A6VLZ8_9PLEO|nr:hypothetical protein M011DRAFT_395589 [Sporormia fimetaria CBS 119925]